MNKLTVQFGTFEVTKDFSSGTTFRDIVQNEDLQAVGGWTDNVRALVNGVEMPLDATVPTSGRIVLETAANEKGS